MSWVKGFKITDGLLTGEVLPRIDTDMNLESWNLYPDSHATSLARVQGSGQKWQGIDILNLLKSQPDQTTQLYAGFDVDPGPNADYVRGQIRFMVEKSGYPGMLIFFRKYTDDTTYTDVRLTYSGISIAPVSLDRAKAIWLLFTLSNYSGESMILTGICESYQYEPSPTEYALDGWACNYFEFVSNVVEGFPEEIEESPEFGPAEEPEGYTGGSFDYHSDVIDMPTKPQSVLSLGFINVYKCAANALTDFGAALFPEIHWPSDLTEVGEVLAALSDSIWNSKLIDYVISVHCIPGDVPAGNLEDIKVGARTMTGILARKISNEYVDFDFQSIHTDDIYKNFMDVMCECQLFLPFYGFVSLKPEHWNGGDISVKYRFNVIDGSFLAYVFSKPNKSEMTTPGLIGQYGGSAVVHLPVSSLSYSSMFSGMIGGATQAALGVASGSMTTAVSGAATAAGALGGGMTGGDSKMSNSYNASASFMTRRRPFLLISAPVPAFSTRYNIENGLPSNTVYTLGQCLGFTQAENAILDGIPCTVDEKKRIEEYLKTGVIIKPTN